MVVKVVALKPHPAEASYIPAPLLLMNEPNPAHPVRQFTLRRGEKRFIDVIQHTKWKTGQRLLLQHSVPSQPQDIPVQDYDLTLEAYSDATKPMTRAAIIILKGGTCSFRLLP